LGWTKDHVDFAATDIGKVALPNIAFNLEGMQDHLRLQPDEPQWMGGDVNLRKLRDGIAWLIPFCKLLIGPESRYKWQFNENKTNILAVSVTVNS
jgi:hypothetical protein